ncbi:MBOAT family O-acyltransferase [Mucilaginibacter psychrotolerans]|uniref:MBOAT family protein n=1 Tax=Mucilaginibacter psychrotolerans TaxID=1524096 RepID=A0A4Y8SKE4_9SPHI|nr:MBOAT family O-acyltransferase [Mucilaginibacter psychrotolerans]TFF39559.1 MBOAT family protein [Mucilaginibacter psychrotolerans]
MLFNSLGFALFLPIVFVLYWFVTNKNLKAQNLLLLAASYFFYSCWDYRFLFLLIFSTFLDFYTGQRIYRAVKPASKKFWLYLSVGVNLGLLGVFKYYNFFVDSLAHSLSAVGVTASFNTLDVILPVGISFYTFHGLSYVFDIHNGRTKPTDNFVDYSVFVSFFPLLVAGPIERATHLLPQIEKPRRFSYQQAVNGMRQILWGYFKKVAIADNCAEYANMIFNNSGHYPGSVLLLGAVLFSIQIYCDFSGYSDIALGVARLFGIELLRNFAFPFFSRDIAEFWRRWHISLSSWFKDYLYIPLGGSKVNTWKRVRNTIIIFVMSGLWHGAAWTYIIWGALNALYIIPSILIKSNRNHLDTVAQGRLLPSLSDTFKMLVTFMLTTLALAVFRSADMAHAFSFIGGIFTKSFFVIPTGEMLMGASVNILALLVVVTLFMVAEWLGRESLFAIEHTGEKWPRPLRWAFYLTIVLSTLYLTGIPQQFVYFQF